MSQEQQQQPQTAQTQTQSMTPILDATLRTSAIDRTSPANYAGGNSKKSQLSSTDYRHFQRASELNVAMNMAKSRERFRWSLGYLGVLLAGTGVRWLQVQKLPVGMLLPISAVAAWAAWEWDLGYGTKLERVGKDAQTILNSEKYKHFGKI
eukprot:GEZU01029917.1.p1 GENE.GEZU01029917.1~~GEZU01029917.1.p1  ORF type:complete len:177 (+),score=42.29 GEZU01029917.1:80-532(+)